MNTLRVESTLPGDLEDLIREVIGCCVAVHRELGPGLLEKVYPRAIAMELDDRGIGYSTEKTVPIKYRARLLCHQRIDLLIDDRLVVEVESVERLHPVHVAQMINYLHLTRTRAGLLINVNVPLLKQGIRRIVL